jgi:glycosyltransferase involved in cell wall biosynthesis
MKSSAVLEPDSTMSDASTGLLRIVHVIDYLDPKMGGGTVIAASLAIAQARAGHSVTLVSYPTPGPREPAFDLFDDWGRVNHVLVPNPGKVGRVLAGGFASAVDEALRQADVMHLHNVWGPAMWASYKAARRRGVPYVWLLNGMLDPWSMRQKQLKKKIALSLGVRRAMSDAASLHLSTPHEEPAARALGITSPVFVVANGIFLSEFSQRLAAAPPLKQAFPDLPAGKLMLFLGRIHFKKGLDLLVEGLDRARVPDDWQVVIAGPDDGYLATTRELVSRSKLASRIHFVGGVFGEKKMSLLRSASAFCLPSRQEGFSVAVLEALASGLPSVISTECHFRQVHDVGAGIETTLELDSIADGFSRVMNLSDDALRVMGQSGRDLVERHYTWPVIAQELDGHYRRLIKR